MKYFTNVEQFGGVYSKDKLPKLIKPNFYIVNLDDANGPGSHWVCIYNCHRGECYYFDSYGVDPCEEVVKFMRQSKKKILVSTYQIQQLGTIMCGYYCIHVCNELLNNVPLYDILLQFDPNNYKINDSILMKKLNLN